MMAASFKMRSLSVQKNFKRAGRRSAMLAAAGLAVAGCAALAVVVPAVAQQSLNATVDSADGNIEVLQIRGNVYLIGGAGANIVVSAGDEGVLMVDSGRAENTDKVLEAVKNLTMEMNKFRQPVTGFSHGGSGTVLTSYRPPKPIRFILNTSALPEHTAGNIKIADAGKTFTGGNVTGDLGDVTEGAAILAHENVLQRLTDEKMPTRGLPTESYYGGVMKLSHYFNGEGVVMYHIPNAITDGDSIVHFRTSDVIAAGDIFSFAGYPPIDIAKGGSVQGELAALNRMLEMVAPEFRSEGGTFVVPGHGRVGDTADLAYYRDMVTMIRDRVQEGIKKDKTLAQIKASKPTEDCDPRFGRNPKWTPDQFVEAVYKSLVNPPAKK
jgi:glyoxylase-like metal-dependent hydrolase (beta-lactamase superfamily II)